MYWLLELMIVGDEFVCKVVVSGRTCISLIYPPICQQAVSIHSVKCQQRGLLTSFEKIEE